MRGHTGLQVRRLLKWPREGWPGPGSCSRGQEVDSRYPLDAEQDTGLDVAPKGRESTGETQGWGPRSCKDEGLPTETTELLEETGQNSRAQAGTSCLGGRWMSRDAARSTAVAPVGSHCSAHVSKS